MRDALGAKIMMASPTISSRDALAAKSMIASPMIASRGASSNYSYNTRNFNQNLGGVNINNGMDLAQFTGVMRTMIRQEIKR